MGVRIHIDELVLHGFDPRDRQAFGDALRAELATLFAGGGQTILSVPIPSVPILSVPILSDRTDKIVRPPHTVHIDGVRSATAPRAVAGAVHREVTKK